MTPSNIVFALIGLAVAAIMTVAAVNNAIRNKRMGTDEVFCLVMAIAVAFTGIYPIIAHYCM